MLTIPEGVPIFIAREPSDLRRGFDGLGGLVRDWLGRDPVSGHIFVFRNRRGDRIKILVWDRDGFLILFKRLEQGVFRIPPIAADAASLQVTAQELSLILWGIDPASIKRQPRYSRPPSRNGSPS
jgi:transposase